MKKNDVLNEIESYNAGEAGTVKNNEPSSLKKAFNIILGIFTLIVFFGGLAGLAIYSETEPKKAIMSAGAIFLWFGIVAIASTKMSLDNAPLLVLPVVGGLMVGIPWIMMKSEKSDGFNFEITEEMIIYIILYLLLIVGIAIIILPIINHRRKLQRCSLSIQARCIEIKSRISHRQNGRSVRVYAPKWEYYVNGRAYIQQDNTYSNVDVPQVGNVYEIRVNPHDPDEIYRPVASHRAITLIIGIGFVVMSAIAIVMYGK